MHNKKVTAVLTATELTVTVDGDSPESQPMTEPLPARLALSGFGGTIFTLLPSEATAITALLPTVSE